MQAQYKAEQIFTSVDKALLHAADSFANTVKFNVIFLILSMSREFYQRIWNKTIIQFIYYCNRECILVNVWSVAEMFKKASIRFLCLCITSLHAL